MKALHLFQRPASAGWILECARRGDAVVLMGRAVTALGAEALAELASGEGEIAVLDQGSPPAGLRVIDYAALVALTERCERIVTWP